LDKLGVIKTLFPELEALKHISLNGIGGKNKWEFTLDVLSKLENLLAVLAPQPNQEASNNLMMGLVTLKLGRYRIPLNTHLKMMLTPGRSVKQTLFLAALFHQLKDGTVKADESIEKRGVDREWVANMKFRLQAMCLGNLEIDWVIKIITNYSADLLPVDTKKLPDRREIYRFFNRSGDAGIDAGLLNLANKMVLEGLDLSAEAFAHHLDIIGALYEAWWELSDTVVSPVLCVNGDDLMKTFNLSPGPHLGIFLSEIKEAQAAGEVNSREEAFALTRKLIKGQSMNARMEDGSGEQLS
jgi:poly(A) polymerase